MEEGFVIRITGSYGVGHVLGIVLFMFPLDATVMVESFIIHEGPSRRVIIEICASEQTQVQVEKELDQRPFITLLIKAPEAHEKLRSDYSFEWQGWLARKLELEFARFGVICTQDVLIACCNLLVHLAPNYKAAYVTKEENDLPPMGIEGLLGPYSRHKMEQVCQTVFLATPERTKTNIEASWENFTSTLKRAVEKVVCSCSKCAFAEGWPLKRISTAQISCPRRRLWEKVGMALTAGLYCFLVNIRGPVAVPGKLPRNMAGEIISRVFKKEGMYLVNTERLLKDVLEAFSANDKGSLGRSSGACTIYPTVLETLEVRPDGIVSFELLDGLFVFENRYHRRLNSIGAARSKARSSLLAGHVRKLVPSNCGEHSTLTVTLREGYNELLLQVTAHMSGSYVRINLASTVIAYIGLERTRECEHQPNNPLREEYAKKVVITGVTSPRAAGAKLALAMTRSNPVAQFLCCEAGTKHVLLYGCCLDCGFEQAREGFNVLIVS